MGARRGAAAVLLALVTACTHFSGGAREPVPRADACAFLDSALAASGLRADLTMRGRVTIDVNQYRVRGRFELTLDPRGNLTFDITSTTLLGGHREDAVLSFYADTLRVLDRERGRFYQGADVDALVEGGAGIALDLGGLLRHATARLPACGRVSDVRRSSGGDGSLEVKGRLDGHDFTIELERGRLARGEWPLPVGDDGRNDSVVATYTWVGDRLDGFTVLVPERRWRIKLDAD